jgi:hypothetical protein
MGLNLHRIKPGKILPESGCIFLTKSCVGHTQTLRSERFQTTVIFVVTPRVVRGAGGFSRGKSFFFEQR